MNSLRKMPQSSGQQCQASCHSTYESKDYLLWGSLTLVLFFYLQYFWISSWPATEGYVGLYIDMSTAVYQLVNAMWWGIAMGVLMIGILSKVPREFVLSIFGAGLGLKGILRATAAGVLLDLCSHGVLMVGAKIYERGVSIGQVIAFLIASPWNSFSLTLILVSLIGFPWTVAFILLSMMVAVSVGLLFNLLVEQKFIPSNPYDVTVAENFRFWHEARSRIQRTDFNALFFKSVVVDGIKGARVVVRWVLFGILLAALVKALVAPETLNVYFGPTLAGLGLTVLAATLIEVCSEGSTPIAADLLTRAKAPGNSFAFLMTGVSTDYTEVMVLRDTTKSWKIAILLPLLSVPQIVAIAIIINQIS